jgi:hypothetical protein
MINSIITFFAGQAGILDKHWATICLIDLYYRITQIKDIRNIENKQILIYPEYITYS